MTWQEDVDDWARAANAADALPVSRVESKVRIAAGDLERDNWLLNLLEGIAWVAAITAAATFMANQPEFGRIVPIENATAFTIASVCFAVAMLGPILSFVRWLRRGRRRSGFTLWTNGFILICVSIGLVFMFIRLHVTGGDAGVGPFIGITTLALCLAALGVQLLASEAHAPGFAEQMEREMFDARNRALDALHERGIIDSDLHRRAIAKPFKTLVELGSASEQER